ncbi:MAG: FKBP-type peptidyl-prolyl cis-trans isomerase [Chitinophagaceae bacterium]|nr:FKBP-type peptidyl-prolyl cis-trans isomerase [Chitinophagaceae bacterium]
MPAVKNGDLVSVHYTGRLTTGEEFERMARRKYPAFS